MVPIVFVEISLVSPAAAASAGVEWSIVDATYAASVWLPVQVPRRHHIPCRHNWQRRDFQSLSGWGQYYHCPQFLYCMEHLEAVRMDYCNSQHQCSALENCSVLRKSTALSKPVAVPDSGTAPRISKKRICLNGIASLHKNCFRNAMTQN